MRWHPAFPSFAFLLALASCSETPVRPAHQRESPTPAAMIALPPAASVSVTVQVPAGMQSPPFDVPRSLVVPPNFSISAYARITKPRFIAVAPNGNLLVSQPSSGKILLVRPPATSGGNPIISDFATGLRKPHDIVFHTVGATTYIYVGESHRISRYVYNPSALTAGARQGIVTGLPDASSPGLNGAYGHELKNLALDGNNKLYVSIASTCNVCISDTQSSPVRGAIYQYDASGAAGRLFARGLRNAEGLAIEPGTTELWVVVNNRDNIAYPFNDGSGNYGRVVPSYVDNHPPEEFTRVRDGGDYGWPFCNPNPDSPSGYDNMPFDLDYQMNKSGSVNCAAMDRITKGIQAHSAPLGLTFLHGTNFPAAYRSGAVVGLHGSWNRTVKTGYKVIHFPWDDVAHAPGSQADLVAGWLTGNSHWGRPVDVAVDARGDMLISDDGANAIYKLSYSAPADQVPVASFTYSCSGRTCTFDGRASRDDVGITRFGWRFGNGVDALGAVVRYTYSAAGTYSVRLKVIDTKGQIDYDTQSVTVP